MSKSSFRVWWQKPRKIGTNNDDRQVSFLELFYDLVYVALIAQLSHSFAENISWEGFLNFIFMFIIVWWSWVNGSLYHDNHGNNDFKTRFFTFLQMFGVIGMAIFAGDATGKGANGFAISHAFYQSILAFLWWRSGVHEDEHRPLAYPYVFLYIISIGLFIGSVFIEAPYKFYIWSGATLFSLLLPAILFGFGYFSESTRKQVQKSTQVSSSLVERFGLFTIIVLGEVVVGVVSGASHGDFDYEVATLSVIGTLIAISLWWLYFDFISHRKPKEGVLNFMSWYYLHFPVTAAITATGAGVLYILDHAHDPLSSKIKLLITSCVIIELVCISALLNIVDQHGRPEKFILLGKISMLACAIIFAGLSFLVLPKILFLSLAVAFLLIPVVIAFIQWISTYEA